MLGHSRGKLCHRERGRCLARHQIYHGTIHRFVYYRVPPGSSPKTANFSIRKLSGAITFDWKGLFSICKKPLEAKGLFFRFDTRVGAVSGGAGAWLGPKSVTKRKRRSRRPPPVTLFPAKFGISILDSEFFSNRLVNVCFWMMNMLQVRQNNGFSQYFDFWQSWNFEWPLWPHLFPNSDELWDFCWYGTYQYVCTRKLG